jgi:hypothetical protein
VLLAKAKRLFPSGVESVPTIPLSDSMNSFVKLEFVALPIGSTLLSVGQPKAGGGS